MVQPHIRTPRLPTHRQREFMSVGWQIPEPVQAGGRPVGDHTLLGRPLPGWNLRRELEPCCAELSVIRQGRASEPVHPMCQPLEPSGSASQSL